MPWYNVLGLARRAVAVCGRAALSLSVGHIRGWFRPLGMAVVEPLHGGSLVAQKLVDGGGALASALDGIECFLLDMDGTVYLGDELLPGALRFLDLIRRQGRGYLFLTNNSSRSGEVYAQKLNRLGLAVNHDHVFTSGQATALYLRRLKPRARIYLVGTPALETEFAAHGFTLTDENPDYAVLGFDTSLTYNKLWKLCDLVRAGLPYIATHPDFNCPTPEGFMPDIGAMIAFVRASTGRDPKVIGKPNPEMVQAVVERTGVPEDSLCMIGDRLYTDIAMGQASGITTVLVLSGETSLDDLAGSRFKPDYVYADLDAVADALEISE